MTVVIKAKENPVMTGLITLAALAVTFTGAWTGIGLVDRLHITEDELRLYDLKAHTFASSQFKVLTDELVKIELTNKCRWLKSQIRALDDAIYLRKRDGADEDLLRPLTINLTELQDDYDALACAALMA